MSRHCRTLWATLIFRWWWTAYDRCQTTGERERERRGERRKGERGEREWSGREGRWEGRRDGEIECSNRAWRREGKKKR